MTDYELEPPIIHIERLPAHEQEAAGFIYMNLRSLGNLVTELEQTMALYDFARTGRDRFEWNTQDYRNLNHWMFLAAKAGAITLHGANEIIDAISGDLLRKSPTLASCIDISAKRDAVSAFKNTFPGIKLLRHDASHPESFATPEKTRANSAKDVQIEGLNALGAVMAISGSISGGKYVATHGRQLNSYTMGTCVADLRKVLIQFFSVFDAATKFTAGLPGGQSASRP